MQAFIRFLLRLLAGDNVEQAHPSQASSDPTPNKFKYLDYIEAAIARMAQNSFYFKGWSVTLASALFAFGAVQNKSSLLGVSIATAVLFWGMDAYYLWLERGFVDLYKKAVSMNERDVTFNMAVDKTHTFRRWLKTCLRPHLLAFYGILIAVIVIGIFTLKGDVPKCVEHSSASSTTTCGVR